MNVSQDKVQDRLGWIAIPNILPEDGVGHAGLGCLGAGPRVSWVEPGCNKCWQILRLVAGILRLGHSIFWHWQDPVLESGAYRGFSGTPLRAAASTGMCKNWDWLCIGMSWARLGWATTPSGVCENQTGCRPGGLAHSTSCQVLGLVTSHVRLNCHIPWQAQVLGWKHA